MQDQRITADMPIDDVVSKYPSTINVFFRHGMGCIGCAIARFENIRQGAQVHRINVDVLLEDLNQAVPQAQEN